MIDVLENVKAARLVIAGGGEQTNALRKLAKEIGVDQKVEFLSSVGEEKLHELYRSCDVFALTPRRVGDAFEGFGVVFLEAGAFGKPVVASRSGGAPEAVIENKTGLIVPENSPVETAKAIIRLIIDRDLSARLGNGGHAHAKAHRWSFIADAWEKILTSQP